MFVGKFAVQSSLPVVLLAVLVPGVGRASDQAHIVQHELAVELSPDAHRLLAHDRVTVELPGTATTVTFTLAPALRVESVVLQEAHSGTGHPAQSDKILPFTVERHAEAATQRIVVTLPPRREGRATLAWTYQGAIDDPPKEPRHLRFVTPSETAGHIGPEGVYLSSESHWYPDIEGSLSGYQITAKVPEGWTVVTQGAKIRETTGEGTTSSTWVVRDRSEALTLVANKFVVKTREWKGPSGQRVELATYFFPDNIALADEYLDATAKYLDAYVSMLGEYPFEKFAVVENFFASGLGMPSFTLLGSGSIKRRYVQPYALGHEIVHSWIGNSVFNRAGRGNWVEGLTTYLANYYWHEWTGDAAQAREQRRLMIQGYSLYVAPDQDYPVAQFQRKSDETDNAIGYQKAAFVVHLLRREIGDAAFWGALKTFVARFRNRFADWGDLEATFSKESGRDLRWFFEQWVEQPGAPALSLGEVRADRTPDAGGRDVWRLAVQVRQTGKPFRATVPVQITMSDAIETRWIPISRPAETAELVLSHRPLLVRLDPDLTVFRRLERTQLPPMLNGYVTDRRRTVVSAFSDPTSPLQQVVARIADQEAGRPEDRKTTRVGAPDTVPPEGSVLVLTDPAGRSAVGGLIGESCGDRVALEETGVRIDGQAYEGPALAVLFSCQRANVPGGVVTVLYGVTPSAVAKVSRLLFYYGWQSYVIFRDGAVEKRGLWEPAQDADVKEVRIDASP
jgi:aminopeptidase N